MVLDAVDAATDAALPTLRGRVLFAVDCSGSVGGSTRYFLEAADVHAMLAPDDLRIQWDDGVRELSKEKMRDWIASKRGLGGTAVSCVARYIRLNDFHGVLKLQTDGQVGEREVQLCDQLLHGAALERGEEGWHFERVEVIVVETGSGSSDLNLSVGLPFARCSPSCFRHLGSSGASESGHKIDQRDLDAFRDFVRHQDATDFLARCDAILRVAEARFAGNEGSPSVRDAALKVKRELTRLMSDKLGDDVGARLLVLLQEARCDEAVEVAACLVRDFLAEKGENPALKALDRVVALCEGVAKRAFTKQALDAAISTKLQRAAPIDRPAEELPLAEEAHLEVTSEWFRCPVTLEDSEANVVFLLAWIDGVEGRGFLAALDGLDGGGDFKERLRENPLWLWRRPEAAAKFAEVIDSAVSCQALRDARDAGAPIVVSPTTRAPLAAAFPLSTASEVHAQARRAAVLRVVSGGGFSWGNADLWAFNLFLAIERKVVRNESLQLALPLLRACTKWQLEHSRTFASLSGLPEHPVTRVPVAVAAWLGVAAPMYDYPALTLLHLPYLEELKCVVEVAGYPLPDGWELRIRRLRLVGLVRSELLRQREAKQTLLEGTFKALRQKVLWLAPEELALARKRLPEHYDVRSFVEIDGEADEEQRARVAELLPGPLADYGRERGWAELLALVACVDCQKKLAQCVPPRDLEAAAEAPVALGWPSYGLTKYERSVVAICPWTCRPHCEVAGEGNSAARPWEEAAKACYGFDPTPTEMISAHEAYGRFVLEHKFYPNAAEFALYLRKQWLLTDSAAKRRPALPHLLEQFIDELLESVVPVIAELQPEEYGARFERARNRELRRRIEVEGLPLTVVTA
jgi:hypothetical protein